MTISETYNEDCMELMARYPDKHFDLAVVDPPYGIGASGSFSHYWDSTSGTSAKKSVRNAKKKWDFEKPKSEYWLDLFRISSNVIVWGGNYFTDYLPVSRCWLLYDKKQPETNSFGKFELAWTSFDDICRKFEFYPTHVTQGERIHPTQKPIKLYDWIFKHYAKPGQLILDTHLGSGSSRIAADKAGMNFVGCELEPDYFAAQEKRWREYKMQLKMF